MLPSRLPSDQSSDMPFLRQVVRASLGDITDDTNSTEGKLTFPSCTMLPDHSSSSAAFAMYGLVWTVGSIIGNTIGGTFSHPVERIPWLFRSSGLLKQYPFLLPCLITTGCTAAGLIFAWLFLKEVRQHGPCLGNYD